MNEKVAASSGVSLRKRYFFKLMTNLVGMGVGIGTQSIVPRALGPASYGDFSFLTSFFYQVVGFLNLNTSTAYYTILSQRQHDAGLVRFYLYFTALLGVVLSSLVMFCFAAGLDRIIWPGQTVLFILFGAVWAFLTFYVMVFNDMSDAYGLTVKSELAKMMIKIIGFLAILFLFLQKWLSLTNFFLYHFVILSVTIGFLIWVIRSGGFSIFSNWQLRKEQVKSYIHEFTAFSGPLVVFIGVAVFEGILDRWLLQKYSGNVQQGFYGLAYQIGTLCFFFTSALIPLVARDFAISFGKRDIGEMGRLFSRFVPMLYAVAAYFGCFLAVESKTVMLLLGGKAYTGAVLPIAIMCLFPIHQTYGQMNASVFFAAGNTRLYRNIGLILSGIGLPMTFIILGPTEYGGLQAGAIGLALKMLVLQIVSVNVQLWFHAKMMRLSFQRFVFHQASVIIYFLFCAATCSFIAKAILPADHFVLQFIVSGIFYTIGITALGITVPWIFSLKRNEILQLMIDCKRFVRGS